MKKATLFFCDIRGTFDMGGSLVISDEQIERFVSNLSKLNLYNDTDLVIFTFVTNETLQTVNYMEKELLSYASDDIFMGNHIYSKDDIGVNKPIEMFNYIKSLEQVYSINKNIYYADDTEFYHFIINELNDYFCPRYKFQSIIPKFYGLNDVNNFIESSVLYEKTLIYK